MVASTSDKAEVLGISRFIISDGRFRRGQQYLGENCYAVPVSVLWLRFWSGASSAIFIHFE